MKITFSVSSWEHYLFWQQNDRKKLTRINSIIKDTMRNPFSGLGKPEPLKGHYAGYWSKRIDEEHRLVYSFEQDELVIVSCRYHY